MTIPAGKGDPSANRWAPTSLAAHRKSDLVHFSGAARSPESDIGDRTVLADEEPKEGYPRWSRLGQFVRPSDPRSPADAVMID